MGLGFEVWGFRDVDSIQKKEAFPPTMLYGYQITSCESTCVHRT